MHTQAFAFALALLVADMTNPASGLSAIVVPHTEGWTVTIHDERSLVNEAHPYSPVPESRGTFASEMAHSLVGYGIGVRHSAIVIGRGLGDGWHFYAGHAFNLPRMKEGHGVGYELGHFARDSSVGVEYIAHFH